MATVASEHISIRVNSARLPDYIGKTVRLACRVLQKNSDFMTVEASDGGQVTVQLHQAVNVVDPFIEVIGKVVDGTTIKVMTVVNQGSDLDLKLVNDTVELIHDPRFLTRMFM